MKSAEICAKILGSLSHPKIFAEHPFASKRNTHGFIVTDARFHTNLPSVYAIGAVHAGYSGQLADAAAEATSVIAGVPIA